MLRVVIDCNAGASPEHFPSVTCRAHFNTTPPAARVLALDAASFGIVLSAIKHGLRSVGRDVPMHRCASELLLRTRAPATTLFPPVTASVDTVWCDLQSELNTPISSSPSATKRSRLWHWHVELRLSAAVLSLRLLVCRCVLSHAHIHAHIYLYDFCSRVCCSYRCFDA